MRCRVIPTKLARPCSVVLVDETGSAAGTAAKVAVHHAQTPLHHASSCYLFSRVGQFVLTRRVRSKRPGPGARTCMGR